MTKEDGFWRWPALRVLPECLYSEEQALDVMEDAPDFFRDYIPPQLMDEFIGYLAFGLIICPDLRVANRFRARHSLHLPTSAA